MKYKTKSIFTFLIYSFLISYLSTFSISKALDIDIDKSDNKELTNNNKLLEKDFYIIGPGDVLEISFIGIEELSGRYLILRDGNIQLPLLGTQNISGLTLDQARKKLIELYKDDLIRPEIYLTLANARPLRVSLVGEVQRPGSYTFTKGEGSKVKNSLSSGTLISGFQTVVDAIQKAGGLTFDADISRVKLYRKLPGKKGEFKKTELDLLEMIKTGNQTNNPILFDGDTIQIDKLVSDLNILEKTPNNLTPETIRLHIIGEVRSPGKIVVDAKTQLSQAILMAGGPKSWRYKDKIQLLRVNRNGSIDVKKISFNKQGLSKNMERIALRDGDIIRVHSNLFAKTTDAMRTFLPPIRDIYSLYGVYKLID